MRAGMLRHMVLYKLAEKPLSGYGLCSAIELCTGKRPSYGSIYPLLEKLSEEKLITVKDDGRKKIYSLTKKGREEASLVKQKMVDLSDSMLANIRAFSEMLGIDPGPMATVIHKLKSGEPPLGKITGNMFRLRNLVFDMARDDRIENNHKEMNKELKKIIRKFEAMK